MMAAASDTGGAAVTVWYNCRPADAFPVLLMLPHHDTAALADNGAPMCSRERGEAYECKSQAYTFRRQDTKSPEEGAQKKVKGIFTLHRSRQSR